MTKVYVCELPPFPQTMPEEMYHCLDGCVKMKIERYRRREDRMRTLLAHALTKMMLSKAENRKPCHLKFTVNQYGKYGLSGNYRHFNISHAGKLIVCAIDEHPVGIDIEKREEREYRLFRDIWSEEQEAQFPLEDHFSFHQVWTAKESYTKYLGIGLQADLKNITVMKDGRILDQGRLSGAAVRYLDVHSDYACAVCGETEIESVLYMTFEQIERFYKMSEKDVDFE